MMSVKDKVKTFLKENDDNGWTASEIAEAIDENKTTVHSIVLDLVEQNKVQRQRYEGLIYNRWIT